MKNPKWHRDEIILALDLYFDAGRGPIDSKNKRVIELSDYLNKLPLFEIKPDKNTFRNPNGVSLKLSNFLAIDPTHNGRGMSSYSSLDKEIFEEFVTDKVRLKKIANKIKSVINDEELLNKVRTIENDENNELDSVLEGQILYKLHKIRERDSKIIKEKKKKALKEKGKLECEACGFDFEAQYGSIGAGFIECHHLTPLFNFETTKRTMLDDLILVCSNCHRMFHRNLNITSIDNFKLIIK